MIEVKQLARLIFVKWFLLPTEKIFSLPCSTFYAWIKPFSRSIVRYLNQIYIVRVIQNYCFIFSRLNAFDKKKLAISIKLSSKTQPLSKINQWRSRYWWDFHVHTTTKLKYLTIFTHVVWKIVVINFPHTAGDFLVCTKCFNINYPLMLSQIEKFPSGSNNFSLVHFFFGVVGWRQRRFRI